MELPILRRVFVPAGLSFAGSAWKKDASREEYYLHLFADKQPDLNWDNPKVRSEVHDLMKFWLDKGIDGFRMDVIPFISKDQSFPDFPKDFDGRPEFIYAAGTKAPTYGCVAMKTRNGPPAMKR